MLERFLAEQRDVIIARAASRVAARAFPKSTDPDLNTTIRLFLQQVRSALRATSGMPASEHDALERGARRHGRDLLRAGLTIDQVVHDYGDICLTITALAVAHDIRISNKEFGVLQHCLDDAVAGAVNEYSSLREHAIEDHQTEALGVLAHELRNALNTAVLTFHGIRNGLAADDGSTATAHERSLMRLRTLIGRSLAEVRIDAQIDSFDRINVAEVLAELEVDARLQAQEREQLLMVPEVDREVFIDGDKQVLVAALTNLLDNAFKFTPSRGEVSLPTVVTDTTVRFEIHDQCGGLPEGSADELFRPFEQRNSNRSGMGLGLSICMKAARALRGEVHVSNVPGIGCIFSLELPRASAQARADVDDGSGSPAGAMRRLG